MSKVELNTKVTITRMQDDRMRLAGTQNNTFPDKMNKRLISRGLDPAVHFAQVKVEGSFSHWILSVEAVACCMDIIRSCWKTILDKYEFTTPRVEHKAGSPRDRMLFSDNFKIQIAKEISYMGMDVVLSHRPGLHRNTLLGWISTRVGELGWEDAGVPVSVSADIYPGWPEYTSPRLAQPFLVPMPQCSPTALIKCAEALAQHKGNKEAQKSILSIQEAILNAS